MTKARESWRTDPARLAAARAWYDLNYAALEQAVARLQDARSAYDHVPYESEYDADRGAGVMFARCRQRVTIALHEAQRDLECLTPPDELGPTYLGNLAVFGVGWDPRYRKLLRAEAAR